MGTTKKKPTGADGGILSQSDSFDLGFGSINNDSGGIGGIGLAAASSSPIMLSEDTTASEPVFVEKSRTLLPWYFIAVVAGASVGYFAMGAQRRRRDETESYIAYSA